MVTFFAGMVITVADNTLLAMVTSEGSIVQLLNSCHDVIKSSHAVVGFSLVPSHLATDRSLISAKQTLTRIHPTYERPSIVSKSESDIF